MNIECLRDLPARWRAEDVHDGKRTSFRSATACADELDALLQCVLADYERLRGMEERVKGAVVATLRLADNDVSDWLEVDSEGLTWQIRNALAGQTVALVPVPGGE